MISFNTPSNFKQSHTGILINQHVTVQAAADISGYKIQHRRRLLCPGKLEGIKISENGSPK
jgi:hypothetical protein